MFASLLVAGLIGFQTTDGLPGPRECLDDNHVNRCDDGVQAQVRRSLGVAAIEDEAAAGAEIYRAFFVDGYGRDMPAVAFERRPGRGPEAVVHGPQGRVMRAAVSREAWARVVERSRFADRRLEQPAAAPAPAEGTIPPPPVFCLHSWVQTVEMANSPVDRWKTQAVRRRTEDACGGALTTEFAFFLADEAVKALAPCETLDPEQTRNRITQLDQCLGLGGDRLAAAELANARSRFGPRARQDMTNANVWRAALGTNGSPRLSWAGQSVQTEQGRNNPVAEFIAARMAERPDLRFLQQRFEGRSSREGVIEGEAYYTEGEISMVAPYRQIWVWDPGLNEWMLSEWTVEPFRARD